MCLRRSYGPTGLGPCSKLVFYIDMFGQNQSPAATLHGLSFMEKLNIFDPTQEKWNQIKGNTYKYCCLDTLGNIWGLNWKRQIVTGNTLTADSGFQPPQSLTFFVIGPDRRIWGLTAFGQLYSGFLDNKDWVKVGNQKMKKLAIDTNYRVWGITDSGEVHSYESSQGPNGKWQKVNSSVNTGKVVDILTTPNGGIWILNEKGDVLERLVNDVDWRIRKNLASNNVTGVRHFTVKPFDVFGVDAFYKTYRFRDGHWVQFGNDKMPHLF